MRQEQGRGDKHRLTQILHPKFLSPEVQVCECREGVPAAGQKRVQRVRSQRYQCANKEFLACSIDPSVLFQDIYIHQAFSDIDTNRNNVVTVQEFSEYINDLVPDHGIQEELIRELDIDKDGNIDLPSFTSTLKQISKSL